MEIAKEGSPVDAGQNTMVINLDLRIFILTILLSVVLLSISVMDYLVSFKIIDVYKITEWKFLLYYLITESLPSITIACFLNSQKYQENDALSSGTGLDRHGIYSEKSDPHQKHRYKR